MPNLNAALGYGQLEVLGSHLLKKRQLAMHYKQFFQGSDYGFFDEPVNAESNFWLNTVVCTDLVARDEFIKGTNSLGIMTRPIWQLMHRLPMFQNAERGTLENSEWFEARAVNIPSSPVEL
jgi:dTDP-4-amino-4,6-dideoxygalactose transaminase